MVTITVAVFTILLNPFIGISCICLSTSVASPGMECNVGEVIHIIDYVERNCASGTAVSEALKQVCLDLCNIDIHYECYCLLYCVLKLFFG